MSKKGFSLIEVLVTLGILGIFTGIATVSYQGYILDVAKRTLKDSGKLFQVAVNTCIQKNMGWKIYRYRQATDPPCPAGKTDRCIEVTPCKADSPAELKPKLNFTCPSEANCTIETKDTVKYHCLSIQKKVSGKYLQVLVRIPYENLTDYQIWCGEVASTTDYLPLGSDTCKGADTWDKVENGSTTQTGLQAKGFKKGDDCWK